jgi:hypothetical protein
MKLRNKLIKTTERAFEFGIKVVEPFAEIKPTQPTAKEIDTQELAERAGRIIDTDPSRATLASLVMMELDEGRMTPEQVDHYLTPPESR